MSATIKDIRNETGLSLATISKYLNGGNVLPENKEKIDEAVAKLNYQVNEMARGLVTNRTYTVGILAQKIASIFNGVIMEAIGRELRKYGYGMLICDSSDDAKTEAENVRFLMNKKVDGMIVIAAGSDPEAFVPAIEAGIPIVFVDRWIPELDVTCVTLDNRQAARRAVDYLIRNGHRRVALISSGEEITGVEREAGFREAMEAAEIPVDDRLIFAGKHTVEHGYKSFKDMMALDETPTAVFMTNYDINLGAVMAMNELGINCPNQISMVGIDDLLLPRVVKPMLVVMRQPMREMGSAAVEELLLEIRGEVTEKKRIVFEAEMLSGKSVRRLPRTEQ